MPVEATSCCRTPASSRLMALCDLMDGRWLDAFEHARLAGKAAADRSLSKFLTLP